MSLRKYLSVNLIFCASANDFAKASSLSFPYELTAMTRPPAVTTWPSFIAVPEWNTMLPSTSSMPVMGYPLAYFSG